jgi:hypothetical protein
MIRKKLLAGNDGEGRMSSETQAGVSRRKFLMTSTAGLVANRLPGLVTATGTAGTTHAVSAAEPAPLHPSTRTWQAPPTAYPLRCSACGRPVRASRRLRSDPRLPLSNGQRGLYPHPPGPSASRGGKNRRISCSHSRSMCRKEPVPPSGFRFCRRRNGACVSGIASCLRAAVQVRV